MGRRVYEDGNYVWKYVFGEQPSEQGRISTEYGIGGLFIQCHDKDGNYYEKFVDDATEEDYDASYEDVLHLEYSNIPALKKIIDDAGENYIKAKQLHTEAWAGKSGMAMDECRALAEKTSELCGENFNFYRMIEAYIRYMEKSYKEDPEKEDFYFAGEY
jgi:hypothetical protein